MNGGLLFLTVAVWISSLRINNRLNQFGFEMQSTAAQNPMAHIFNYSDYYSFLM